MAKIEVFSTPKQVFFISIEDWQIAVCNGDKCAAALLDFFTKRHKYYLEQCENNSARNKKLGEKIDPYQVQSLAKMNDYTLGLFGRNKLIEAIEQLVSWKFLSCKSDAQNNKSYLLLTEPIQAFIDNEWIPFLKTVGEKENPLQLYLKRIGFSKTKKVKVASLESNEQEDNFASLGLNDPSLILNDQTAFASLILNGGSLESNEHIVTIGNKDVLVTTNNNNAPIGSFSDENVKDYELQLAQKAAQEKFEAAQKKARLEAERVKAELDAAAAEKEKKLREKKKVLPVVHVEMFCSFDNPNEAMNAWKDWEEYKREEKGQKFKTEKSRQLAINQLCQLASKKSLMAKKIIEQSMGQLWTGLFQLRQQTTTAHQSYNSKIIDSSKYDQYAPTTGR